MSSTILNNIQNYAEKMIQEHHLPAVSIAVWQDGQLQQGAAGILNQDTGVEATTDSIFQIGSIDSFKDDLRALYASSDLAPADQKTPDFITKQNWLTPILSWVLPILIIVGIWVFIMRRVGGGAGGPGAQIFNIWVPVC